MEYFYAVMWLVAGIVLIFVLSKENKVFYFAGGFFIVLAVWWFLEAATELQMFEGGLGIAIKVITAVAVVVLGIVFIKNYRKNTKEAKEIAPEPTGKKEK